VRARCPAFRLLAAPARQRGRVEATNPELTDRLLDDPRFVIDEVPLLALIRAAISSTWTRDPFDRVLAAHSVARRVPLVTLDGGLRRHHAFIARELRDGRL
jgi:PIN domain nuclease of toxin-antitoxin system